MSGCAHYCLAHDTPARPHLAALSALQTPHALSLSRSVELDELEASLEHSRRLTTHSWLSLESWQPAVLVKKSNREITLIREPVLEFIPLMHPSNDLFRR